jgi:DNA repair exonuclease SbcCD ATPase subunit
MELREAQLHEREADVARLTVRADRIEAELESQRAALADAEIAVDRERAVLQRRMAEIESRESAAREELDEAVRAATEDGGRRGLRLRGDGKDAGALEELHAALRNREAQLQAQERRLAEQQSTLHRREADLELYARKLQQGGGAPLHAVPAPAPELAEPYDEPDEAAAAEAGGAAKRLNFWSR